MSQTAKIKWKHHCNSHFLLTRDVVTDFSGPPGKKEQGEGVGLMAKHRKIEFTHFTTGTGITNGDFCR